MQFEPQLSISIPAMIISTTNTAQLPHQKTDINLLMWALKGKTGFTAGIRYVPIHRFRSHFSPKFRLNSDVKRTKRRSRDMWTSSIESRSLSPAIANPVSYPKIPGKILKMARFPGEEALHVGGKPPPNLLASPPALGIISKQNIKKIKK